MGRQRGLKMLLAEVLSTSIAGRNKVIELDGVAYADKCVVVAEVKIVLNDAAALQLLQKKTTIE